MLLQKSIILFLFVVLTNSTEGQLRNSRFFSSGGFPCSRNILLDSLGYFFKEEGCEGNSRISYGKYTVSKGNIIAFRYLPLDSIKPISQIKYNNSNNDSLLTITLFDRDNNPLGFNFNLKFTDTSGQVVENPPYTDLEGRITIKPNQFKEILLNDLLPTFNAMPIKIDSQSIEIRFNLPGMFLYSNEVTAAKPEKLQLLLTDKGLMTVDKKQIVYAASK